MGKLKQLKSKAQSDKLLQREAYFDPKMPSIKRLQ